MVSRKNRLKNVTSQQVVVGDNRVGHGIA
ncbi:hypothetical protein KsCSTR_25230 [Candidatus Kuenenia stuttgartiensis]|uniref:Uncharacterized protein n=1 Tax=Kuenenia stuttgartiensis TaxID=174633 RepID=A0A6G7GR99_KUEST|nr:hypothetical protein KsCSTR_25230 [Candidatus Kuenenia stuttgartiensis]